MSPFALLDRTVAWSLERDRHEATLLWLACIALAVVIFGAIQRGLWQVSPLAFPDAWYGALFYQAVRHDATRPGARASTPRRPFGDWLARRWPAVLWVLAIVGLLYAILFAVSRNYENQLAGCERNNALRLVTFHHETGVARRERGAEAEEAFGNASSLLMAPFVVQQGPRKGAVDCHAAVKAPEGYEVVH